MNQTTGTGPRKRASKGISEEMLWNQLIKLGDMMGDGLHHEEPWIAKEYKRISRKLMPEHFQDIRKKKTDNVDEQMIKLLETFRCKCGGVCRQSRKGSKVAYCNDCNMRYMAKGKK